MSPEDGVTISPDYVVVDGNTTGLNLTCVSEAMFGIRYQWWFNGLLLANEDSHTLSLNDISATTNGGEYQCIVSNVAGTGSANATVFFHPIITAGPSDQTARNGSLGISFNCSATGFPEPYIEWHRVDNEHLPTSIISSSGDTSTLTFDEVEFGAEGLYYCSALALGTSTTSNTATLYSKSETTNICALHIFFHYSFSRG